MKRRGSASTHSKNRARLRKKLRALGLTEAEITERLERRRLDQLVDRHGLETAHRLNNHLDRQTYGTPDDTGFRPKAVDPLLRGVARATGETARAVKRGSTIRRWEYNEGPNR